MMSELLIFPNEIYGMVLNLEEGAVGAVLMGMIQLFVKVIKFADQEKLLKLQLVMRC